MICAETPQKQHGLSHFGVKPFPLKWLEHAGCDVTNIQEAAVVNHPENPEELALFLFETYYPITNDMVIFASEMAAEQAYQQ